MSLSRRGSSSATRTVCFLLFIGTFRTTRWSSYCDFGRFRQQRQREAKCAAIALSLALSPDPPSVRFDQSLADRQSKSGAANAPRVFTVDTMEPVKDSID